MTTWISNVFETVLQMSLTASFVCLVICFLRLLLKRAPKIFSYALWVVVFVRLVCPVTLNSPVSIVPSQQQWLAWTEMAEQIPGQKNMGISRPTAEQKGGQESSDPLWADRENGRIDGNIAQIGQNGSQMAGMINGIVDMADDQDGTVSRPSSDHKAEHPTDMVASSERPILTVAAMVWFVGAMMTLFWQCARTYRWKWSLGQTRSVEDGVYTADGIVAPFVMGLFHPAIYLPEKMTEEERVYVLLHERTHLHRKDYWIKTVAFGICCVHWFNPLAWLAFRLMCMDMEMSCDEAVLQQMHGQQKKAYANTLLSFADRTVSGGSLAFGEPYAKKRIRNVLQYRRPAYRWMLVLTVMCVALAGCLLTDPVDDSMQDGNDVLETQNSEEGTKEEESDTTISETMPSETQQEESEKETTEDDLYFAQMEAYWNSFRVGSTSPQITDKSVSWEADLNHDGTPERIVFDWGYMDMAAPAMFAVLDNQGTVVYMEEPANAHVGWMNYYVCELDGRDYLFSYSPYVSTGILGYYYNLMELDDQGKMVMVDQGNASCILGDGEFIQEFAPDEYMNIPQMVEFAVKLNDYLEHSYLLFSTDESWVELDFAANVLFVTGDSDNPYRKYENYGEFSGESRGAQKPTEDQLRQALLEWCVEMEYPYTEDGITIINAPMTEDEWFDAWQRHLDSYQVGSTEPLISDKSTSWSADLDHDGVDERIVFDWYFLDNATPGTFAILESDGRVVYMSDRPGTPHVGWISYYVCQKDGKEYLLSYCPYTGTGWGEYEYVLMELNAQGQLQTVEQDDTEFRGDPVEYIKKEWPEYRMDIKDMAAFAEGVNELLDSSYLLVSTDKGWMNRELNATQNGFILGSEDVPFRQYEDYHGLRGKLPALQAMEKPEQGTIYELLKNWCEAEGMPYVK